MATDMISIEPTAAPNGGSASVLPEVARHSAWCVDRRSPTPASHRCGWAICWRSYSLAGRGSWPNRGHHAGQRTGTV